jgi:hypothetical protein
VLQITILLLLLFSASEGYWISFLLSLEMTIQAKVHLLDVFRLKIVHFHAVATGLITHCIALMLLHQDWHPVPSDKSPGRVPEPRRHETAVPGLPRQRTPYAIHQEILIS